jgi:peptide/nickel transport system substrate-binding protein
MKRSVRFGSLLIAALALASPVLAQTSFDPPILREQVESGRLPPLAQRLPKTPKVSEPIKGHQTIGRHGGDVTVLMSRARDTRIIFVYAYARLVSWTNALNLEADILEAVEVEEDRIFTLRLRAGHRWSDGHPFTTEDFRYWWEDIANNKDLTPFGPPSEILVDRRPPQVEILSETVLRYSWDQPNPYFLPALAGPRPVMIYSPAHYLRRFHARYADVDQLRQRAQAAGQRGWAQLHNRLDNGRDFDNPELPTLQPWVPTTAVPAERFVFMRNAFFHRVDPEGRQLPYLDRIIMQVADSRLIPAKTGAGESDLQSRYIRFDNYTFLKDAEQRNNFDVRLWKNGTGAQLALYPNMNATDPVWRALNRDVRFRRALSLAINRDEINQVVYFGLANPSQNTVLPESPLYKDSYRDSWAGFDLRQANRLLDEIGLNKRDRSGIRLLPDGRPLEIIVETAGESTEETDVLQLIGDSWKRAGVKLFTRPSQLEVFRNRIYAGEAVMVISKGIDNGIPTPLMAPGELVPVDQTQYQWPKWGQWFQTRGGAGEEPDLPVARELMDQLSIWQAARNDADRAKAWARILEIHAENVFSIGLIAGVQQPIVVRRTLRNVPKDGLFNWDPGAFFGIYRPDLFWMERRS